MGDISPSIKGNVVAVCRNPEPGLPKPVVEHIYLLADLGIEGDYHAGKFVRHRYLANKYPTRRNMRQVLIVDASAYAELAQKGIAIGPGSMGENITVEGIAVMELAEGTRLTVGGAIVEITEVRKPCAQLNGIDPKLLKAVTSLEAGKKVYKAGIMTRVLQAGWVKAEDHITVMVPDAIQQAVFCCHL
ncbi:MAG: MOSC domain-containing protein [Ktedonobacteraceae bacterium]